jgi:hypothetical protein
VIFEDDFKAGQSLREVRFSTGSSIRPIHGFRDCSSLSYVEIPQSIEYIDSEAFSGDALRLQMTLVLSCKYKCNIDFTMEKVRCLR